MIVDKDYLIRYLNSLNYDKVDLHELITQLEKDEKIEINSRKIEDVCRDLMATSYCSSNAIFFNIQVIHYAAKGDIKTQLKDMFGNDKLDICEYIHAQIDNIRECTAKRDSLIRNVLGGIPVSDTGVSHQLDILLRILLLLIDCNYRDSEILYAFIRPMKFIDNCKDLSLNPEILKFRSSSVYMNLLLIKVRVDAMVSPDSDDNMLNSLKGSLNFLATFIPSNEDVLECLLN